MTLHHDRPFVEAVGWVRFGSGRVDAVTAWRLQVPAGDGRIDRALGFGR